MKRLQDFRTGSLGGKFEKGGAAQEAMSASLHGQMKNLQKLLVESRESGKNANQLAQILTAMEVTEQAMTKVAAGEMIGGQGIGLKGSSKQKRADKGFEELYKLNVQLQPIINVTIPAEVSLTGKEEVFKLRQQVQSIQAQIGTPGSRVGGGMGFNRRAGGR